MCNLMLLIVEREIGEKMDKLVQERVAECLKTYIPQATSNRGPPQQQPHHGSQLLHTGLPISPRNPPSALQGPSSPTLSHTIASPLDLTHPSALAHSSKNLSLTLPPPTSSTRSISDVSGFIPRTAAKLTIKRADGTEVSLENITKITPTVPAKSSPQSLVFRQGSSGSPNRNLHMETEDQHKSRLAELKQNDRQKAEAADKEKKEKEKVEAERKAKATDEIHKLEKAARLEKERKGERLRKEAEALELQRLKEEEERRLNLKQERTKVEKEWKEKEKEKEEREEQERLSKLAEETQLRLGEETAAKARVEAFSEPELEEREEAELEAHKGDGKQEGQLEAVSGALGMPYTSHWLSTIQETAASQSGAGAPLQKCVRTKRNRIENNMVPGGSGGQSHGSAFSNMNQMQNLDLVVPLQATENRWDRKAIQVDQDSPELVERKVKGLLNKLTMEKFASISDQIIAWANKSEKEKDGHTLFQVIRLVFEKATDEATWSEMYARLCRKMMEQISTNVQDDGIKNPEGKPIAGGQLFRKYLLNRCQEDFERGWVAKEATAAAAATKALKDETPKVTNAKTKEGGTEEIVLYSDEHYAAQKARRQGLGLIKFIGELFKLQMLTERIMHECIKKLLGNVDNPEEEEIESLCTLLTTVGSMLDIQKARGHLDVYFSRMKELMKSPNVSPQMQYMLQVGHWSYLITISNLIFYRICSSSANVSGLHVMLLLPLLPLHKFTRM